MHDLTFGQMSRCQTSLAVKGPQSNVTYGQVFQILVADQKSAVKCHCSQMSWGQMSRRQMSLAVKFF